MGEEIGLGENLALEGRDSVRAPLQWTDGRNGGFSTAPADKLVRPVIKDGQFGYSKLNIMAQQRDPGSFLNWMRRLISVRRGCPEIGSGELGLLKTDQDAVLAQLYDLHGQRLLILHNLSSAHCSVE